MPHCANCGTPLDDQFCPHCGQPAHEGHAPTLGHFFHEVTHEFLHVDGKIVRTVKALLLAPGKLTAEYWAGHIADWVRPIRLFLIIAAVHLIVSSGIGPLNFKVVAYRNALGHVSLRATPTPDTVMQQQGLQPLPEEERKMAFEKFEKAYLSIRYLSPILFALASWLLYRRRQPYFVNHLVEGLHFYAFWYFLAIVVASLGRWQEYLNVIGFISVPYLYLTVRRLYKQRWFVTLATTALLFASLIVIEFG